MRRKKISTKFFDTEIKSKKKRKKIKTFKNSRHTHIHMHFLNDCSLDESDFYFVKNKRNQKNAITVIQQLKISEYYLFCFQRIHMNSIL